MGIRLKIMSRKKSISKKKNPRILIVTPEITYLPEGMGNAANYLTAKAGGLADVSASLVSALYDLGADVHVALPNFRRIFHIEVTNLINEELRIIKTKMPDSRVHLAEDRAFYYKHEIYGASRDENPSISLAFQREVINNIVPHVKPDLIHCNDWMTSLIPAMARRRNIPCLLTVHNLHTHKMTLAAIEDRGIDAAEFWQSLFFSWPPHSYEESRASNPVDFLCSGLFASHFINTVSPTFLKEAAYGKHHFIPGNIRYELEQKMNSGCAVGILNSPDPKYNPENDTCLISTYDSTSHHENKKKNKVEFQRKAGLRIDENAPLFFWPSRLDPVQKGCQLLTDILFGVISKYWADNLQVAVVANGPYQEHFHNIARHHDIYDRVAVWNFDECLSRLGYAASDFVLIPSSYEPCGLPQMIGAIYGSLPIAHDTGGLHDTVSNLDLASDAGNGFLFNVFDSNGLFWAIDQAMDFYKLPVPVKRDTISRIMRESKDQFNHSVTAGRYIDIYEKMLNRPLINLY